MYRHPLKSNLIRKIDWSRVLFFPFDTKAYSGMKYVKWNGKAQNTMVHETNFRKILLKEKSWHLRLKLLKWTLISFLFSSSFAFFFLSSQFPISWCLDLSTNTIFNTIFSYKYRHWVHEDYVVCYSVSQWAIRKREWENEHECWCW